MATRTRIITGKLRIDDGGIRFATYDLSGTRVSQGKDFSTAPTAEQLAEWDEMAPLVIDAMMATEVNAIAAPTRVQPRRVGRYGTCDPADCDGIPVCQGDCSGDSGRPRRYVDREWVAEQIRW